MMIAGLLNSGLLGTSLQHHSIAKWKRCLPRTGGDRRSPAHMDKDPCLEIIASIGISICETPGVICTLVVTDMMLLFFKKGKHSSRLLHLN